MNDTTVLNSGESEQPPLREGTKYFGPDSPGPDDAEKLWAAAVFAPLPDQIKVRIHSTRHVRVWRDEREVVYRDVGRVFALLDGDEDPHFRIELFEGATPDDLSALRRVVKFARQGSVGSYGWRPGKSSSTSKWQSFWFWNCGILDRGESAGEEPVVRCDDHACAASWHEYSDDAHTRPPAETIHALGGWELALERRPGELWEIVSDFSGERDDRFTVAEAVSFANDLQWLAAEARRLNEKREVLCVE